MGARIDGHLAQLAIRFNLGVSCEPARELAEQQRRWAERLLRCGALTCAAENRWQFVRLPSQSRLWSLPVKPAQ